MNVTQIYLILAIIVALFINFIPTMIAFKRKHHNRWAIFWLNLFAGWTMLGWVGAFVWACTQIRTKPI